MSEEELEQYIHQQYKEVEDKSESDLSEEEQIYENLPQQSNDIDSIHEAMPENIFEATEDNINQDALYVYDFINQVMGIDEENILVYGRSIGSGPATYVASKRKPGCLFLMSAFKSIRAIA